MGIVAAGMHILIFRAEFKTCVLLNRKSVHIAPYGNCFALPVAKIRHNTGMARICLICNTHPVELFRHKAEGFRQYQSNLRNPVKTASP